MCLLTWGLLPGAQLGWKVGEGMSCKVRDAYQTSKWNYHAGSQKNESGVQSGCQLQKQTYGKYHDPYIDCVVVMGVENLIGDQTKSMAETKPRVTNMQNQG